MRRASPWFPLAMLMAAVPLPGQATATLRINDDGSPSGYAGTAPRIVESGTTPQITIAGPVGHRVFLFAGARLEPGVPFPGSPWPIHLAGFVDASSLLGDSQGLIREDHVPDGRGLLEVGLLMPAFPSPLQVALQAVVLAPGGGIVLTNPIEIVLTGGSAGPVASVGVQLTTVVEEADEGGVLQVGAVARDAFGRIVRPTPPFQVSTNAAGATMPTPTSLAFRDHGPANVTVAVTGTTVSASRSIRVVPEVVRGAFVDRVQRGTALHQAGLLGLQALANGDVVGVDRALATLATGLQPGNMPPLIGSSLMMPLLRPYPTVAQLIASGQFPTNPDDAQLPGLIAALTSGFQQVANFLSLTPFGSLTYDQLAELGARYEALRTLVDNFESRSFSGRALWQNLSALQVLLDQALPDALRRALERGRQALDAARTVGGFARSLGTAYRSFGLGGLALRLYEQPLRDLGGLAAGMAANGLINWVLQNVANLNLCQACSTSCLAGCSGVVQGCAVELDGDGFAMDPAVHRVIVVSATANVAPVRATFTGQDSIVDMVQAVANLNVLFPQNVFVFPPDSIGPLPLFCGNANPLEVNSWPLQNTHPWGLPQVISVLVLRLDAGISNAFQWLQI